MLRSILIAKKEEAYFSNETYSSSVLLNGAWHNLGYQKPWSYVRKVGEMGAEI